MQAGRGCCKAGRTWMPSHMMASASAKVPTPCTSRKMGLTSSAQKNWAVKYSLRHRGNNDQVFLPEIEFTRLLVATQGTHRTSLPAAEFYLPGKDSLSVRDHDRFHSRACFVAGACVGGPCGGCDQVESRPGAPAAVHVLLVAAQAVFDQPRGQDAIAALQGVGANGAGLDALPAAALAEAPAPGGETKAVASHVHGHSPRKAGQQDGTMA